MDIPSHSFDWDCVDGEEGEGVNKLDELKSEILNECPWRPLHVFLLSPFLTKGAMSISTESKTTLYIQNAVTVWFRGKEYTLRFGEL